MLGRALVLTGLPGWDVSGVNGGVGRCGGYCACNCGGGGGGVGDRDDCAGARSVGVLALAVESNVDCAAIRALSKAAPGEAR